MSSTYMEVNKTRRLHFGMGEIYNALQLVFFVLDIYSNQRFLGVGGMILLEKIIRKMFFQSINSWRHVADSRLNEWRIQHGQFEDHSTLVPSEHACENNI